MALCEWPHVKDWMPLSCGKCEPCKIRRKRLWAGRIMLESLCHGDSAFVTLTYDQDHVPDDGSLRPQEAQAWLKRLRKEVWPRKLRYYLVGEYGEQTWRPHYHAAIFGLSSVEENTVRKTWGLGHVRVGTLTPASAQYVAGYVTKKMAKNVQAAGKEKEFQRMSLKPGIGAPAMPFMAEALASEAGLNWILANGDVPFTYLSGRSPRSLGRYLRRELRGQMGFGSKDTPREKLAAFQKEMRELQRGFEDVPSQARRLAGQMFFVDRDQQKLRNLLSRHRVFEQKKEL